jgi:hypothetical protein
MFLPSFLFSPAEHRAREQREKEYILKHRVPKCVPWSPDMKWERQLNLQAKTYTTFSLFPVEPVNSQNCNECLPSQAVVSPHSRFLYCEKKLKMGWSLPTVYGREEGTVIFDGPVVIPALHEAASERAAGKWDIGPWMSLTPSELFTLRPGTKRAKGDVIVAGLGLGHQLIEVSKRKQVKKLILVEKSQELVDWLLPHIRLHMARPVDDVVVGDAYEVMPKLRADVALVDIFPSYGFNSDERKRLERTCPNIGFIWAWGAYELPDRGWRY